MPAITLQTLGRMLAEQRGSRGVREVAREIGISHSTLSRVERGYLPDLETFGKICKWLNVDPGEVLGVKPTTENQRPEVFGHFRKEQTISVSTAQALAQMILAAHQALITSEEGQKEGV